jgi:hypothetical protein
MGVMPTSPILGLARLSEAMITLALQQCKLLPRFTISFGFGLKRAIFLT